MRPIIFAAAPLAAVVVLGAMIAFGTRAPPPALDLIGDPFKNADYSDLPPVTSVRARDGTSLAVHIYRPPGEPAEASRVAIAVHGSSATGSSLHFLAKTLRDAGFTVYAPDIRGHGGSGRRGDIDYANQLDDDLADLVAAARAAHPKASLTLVGFSSGGGFALHAAATPLGREFIRTVLVSPMLGPQAPTVSDTLSDWARPYLPRIIAQVILGRLGIHAFDGLPALAFAIAPENADRLTGVYSSG